MSSKRPSADEARLEALFRAAGRATPAPDEAFLARLREESAAAFLAARAETSGVAAATEPGDGASPLSSATSHIPPRRRSTMVLVLYRTLAATAAAVALAAAWMFAPGGGQSPQALGQAIDRLAAAESLQLELTRGELSGEAWVRPGKLRWNTGEGKYQVIRGDRLWQVDEQANRATTAKADVFSGPQQSLDPLKLIGIDEAKQATAVRAAAPTETVERDGQRLSVYRVEGDDDAGRWQVEAEVEVRSGRLCFLTYKRPRPKGMHTVAALRLVKFDAAAPEDLFVVGEHLSEDGRAGKLTDVQGLVAVRPVGRERFTPIGTGQLIMPGDLMRAEARGANAAAIRLTNQTTLTIGPGASVEVVQPDQLRVISGELKIVPGPKTSVQLIAPNGSAEQLSEPALLRAETGKLARLKVQPKWLDGFEGRSAGETLGSLIVQIDGRNVPLTVGYHKVTVDIRDQIARTTVEESFVNRTDGRLEGVFHFPLPQDASISGFGMWIGGELVEADVVEKQRAREIYETILRERRDPGLLEWTGGNIFKARVFPIEARSEKRIKITYTQVLPLAGTSYRYSYALQSELLRQHPLRELSVIVNLHSAVPLQSVTCPTHAARIRQTEHSASVEFAAKEYTPTSDFEVVVEPQGNQPELVLIPHRRGEDGYFMLMITPPALEPAGPRGLLADGEPLDLLVLADTSASIDMGSRQRQADFLTALLGSLTPNDHFNLAVFDVDCQWAFDNSRPANAESIAAAEKMLAQRESLGWTDLEAAFAAALKRAGPATRIIYLGDGVPATVESEPAALVQRLTKLYREKASAGHGATCYAVSLGSSYDSAVLKAIAALGGGSVRQLGGELSPAIAAREVLEEFSKPSLKDVSVSFSGIRTARVYPSELPNVPTGTQQIVLGRYLPEGKDQSGEVVVTGTLDGKPIRYARPITLRDGDESDSEGNSFIPRLWARMHLDYLLAQGASQAIRDEIIALSEEYHIITPYTSLLVLESDEDRERFKVKRGFQMRDGERFFAEGRDAANFELLNQQMQLAGTWRLGLRRQVLLDLAQLGRPRPESFERFGRAGGGGFRRSGREDRPRLFAGDSVWFSDYGLNMPMSGPAAPSAMPMGASISANGIFSGDLDIPFLKSEKSGRFRLSETRLGDFDSTDYFARDMQDVQLELEVAAKEAFAGSEDLWAEGKKQADFESLSDLVATTLQPESWDEDGDDVMQLVTLDSLQLGFGARAAEPQRPGMAGEYLFAFESSNEGYSLGKSIVMSRRGGLMADGRMNLALDEKYKLLSPPGYIPWQIQHAAGWMLNTIPSLPAPPAEPPAEFPAEHWSAEAKKLAERLLRRDAIEKYSAPWRTTANCRSFDPATGKLTNESRQTLIASADRWLWRSEGTDAAEQMHWVDATERGTAELAQQLGRVREAQPADRTVAAMPLHVAGHTLYSLARSYHNYKAEVLPAEGTEDSQVTLVVSALEQPYELRYVIDTRRAVVVRSEVHSQGKLISTVRYSEFFEFAGRWWAGQSETFDAEGRRTNREEIELAAIEPDAFTGQYSAAMQDLEPVLLVPQPGPTVVEAKLASAAGKASLADRLTLAVYFSFSQQWDRVLEEFAAAEALAKGKPGVRWLKMRLLAQSRRQEELKNLVMAEAEQLMEHPRPKNEAYLARTLHQIASGVLGAHEQLALIEALRPIAARQTAPSTLAGYLREQRASCLEQAGQTRAALGLREEIAAESPRDANAQMSCVRLFEALGERAEAIARLQKLLAETYWQPHEREMLLRKWVELVNEQGRYQDVLARLETEIDKAPTTAAAYTMYLAALLRVDRMDDATRHIRQWLELAKRAGELDEADVARLSGTANFLNGYELSFDRIPEQWEKPMADAALRLARDPKHGYLADQIANNWRFSQSQAARELRRRAARTVANEVDQLSPQALSRLIGWAQQSGDWEPDERKRIAERLIKRWETEKKPEERRALVGVITGPLSGALPVDAELDFLRRVWCEAEKDYRAQAARQLFDRLLTAPWSAAREGEAFELIKHLSEGQPAEAVPAIQVAGMLRWVDAMGAARLRLALDKIEHPEKLTRIELRNQRLEAARKAQEEFAQVLRARYEKQQGVLRDWLHCEWVARQVQLGNDLGRMAEECFEVLPTKPQRPSEDTISAGQQLKAVLEWRYLVTLVNLAARREAKPELRDRVKAYLDAGLAADPKDPRYRTLKFMLLVALDEPAPLRETLEAWSRLDGADFRWRLVLGYLLAEQGKLKEAVRVFEAAAAADELGFAEWRRLADWHTALGNREAADTAKIAGYKTIDEWQLRNRVQQEVNRRRNTQSQAPPELDPEIVLVLRAGMQKTSDPANHIGVLRELYRETRDFRLLECLADGILGHTAEGVYRALGELRYLLDDVHEEATADSLVRRIDEVRQQAKSAVDRRALDLLTMLIERRAAELLNQPGPHAARAVVAFERATTGELLPGEARPMAEMLASLGRINQGDLAKVQVRQLEKLSRLVPADGVDGLTIAERLAKVYWAYDRKQEAVDTLTAAIDRFLAPRQGVLVGEAQSAVAALVNYQASQGHFAAAEKVLLAHLAQPAGAQQRQWLTQQLYGVYERAIREGGRVSLGEGPVLYRVVCDRLAAEWREGDANHQYQMLAQLCSLFRAANDRKFEGVADDLRQWADDVHPLLPTASGNYGSMVGTVSQTLHDVASPRDGLGFLISRVEGEPQWLLYTRNDTWSRQHWNMAYWRSEVGNDKLGELSPRLLAIVSDRLRDYLTLRQSETSMTHRHQSYFWSEKADAFARVAEEVLEKHREDAPIVVRVAEYLFDGLGRADRAIAILLDAHRRKLLDESAQVKLVEYLHHENRYGESIAILEPLVEKNPLNVAHVSLLMRAYFHTKQPERLRSLAEETERRLREAKAWNEGAMAMLAEACLMTELYQKAVDHYREAIAQRQGKELRPSNGDEQLSRYYQSLARAYAGLGDTWEAVDAASAAIVCWGPRHERRQEALHTLREVLMQSKDLGAFAARLDAESEKTGMENPIVRKALGKALIDQGHWERALPHLKIAAEVQPNDAETADLLVQCLDQLQMPREAAAMRLEQAQQTPRRAELWRDLGRRYDKLEQPAQAERAYTSIVEMLAAEAEGHQALAEVRQEQNRWPAAVEHWRRVAELRALEPTGLLGLAEAQIRAGSFDDARQTIEQLRRTTWPSRFSDVSNQVFRLEQQLREK